MPREARYQERMSMFGHMPELILILIVALIFFGPSRLPEVANALGRGIREFRRATSEIEDAVLHHNEIEPPESHLDFYEPPETGEID